MSTNGIPSLHHFVSDHHPPYVVVGTDTVHYPELRALGGVRVSVPNEHILCCLQCAVTVADGGREVAGDPFCRDVERT